MERSILTAARANNLIEEAYAPHPPEPTTEDPFSSHMQGSGADGATDVVAAEVDSGDGSMHAGDRGDKATQCAPDADLHSSSTIAQHDAKGKGKEKSDDNSDSTHVVSLPSRPRPGPTGRGRRPDEQFFHTVPTLHGSPSKKRALFLVWPRDPNGKVIKLSAQPRGKCSPDGYPWGATLYDFFTVNLIPDKMMVAFDRSPYPSMACMTGSALLEAMEELGEMETARKEIEWVRSEGMPCVVPVADTAELIEQELPLELYLERSMCEDVRNKALGLGGVDADKRASRVQGEQRDGNCNEADVEVTQEDDVRDEQKNKDDNDNDDTKVSPAADPLSPTISTMSPFHANHYPAPWPLVPFTDPLSVLLQERIPFHLLPESLYVHDPFGLLSVTGQSFRPAGWRSRPDVVRKYSLELCDDAREAILETKRKAEELEEFKAHTLVVLRYKRTKEQIKNHEPQIEIPLSPYSRISTRVEESHLYLSPVAQVRQGHHSIVYKAEWELPRDLFVRPKLCHECFEESSQEELQRLKDTGKWAKVMRVSGWGPNGPTGYQPTQAELDEVNLEQGREIIERELICVVPPHMAPSHVLHMLDQTHAWDEFMKAKGKKSMVIDVVRSLSGDDEEDEDDTDAVQIRINPPFSRGSKTQCNHGPHRSPAPRTAKFSVVAKLSSQDDRQLPGEARNYQRFPERFFQHYNGYTHVSQLHAIVPVNAVVPQFYGYYTPHRDLTGRWTPNAGARPSYPYLSPILLLEHCGEPIDPKQLSREDQEECMSLLLRFQRAGWLHDSVTPSSFLVQTGRPTDFPSQRQRDPALSFRLINFGESTMYGDVMEKQEEETAAMKMFDKVWASLDT